MTAFGRKLPFKIAVFDLIECPVLVKADDGACSQQQLALGNIINQNTEDSHADWRHVVCHFGCSAESYAGWDFMISTLSVNHLALVGAVSKPLNAAGAI